ncbi:TetR family transcriptional regulator [Aureimonas sp. Leaf454]|uniref:TetR/AcrR family transcriptional regulator n=1 Tax=Aureimonas sp. Leaf454 TaxID=1736381 RepID=UPI0006FDF3E0|nr:TetR/AcrR family transcriptional regulator C-terminal domain-containing protein [Aureimonas sp. Leaf454]KQT50854.1 TetR family transcriptional regulator [Aureimonas sp. Leaf454]
MDVEEAEIEGRPLTSRQREVLDAALGLLVDAGETLTMSAVAQRASCSKETLYKWFGGRDGLLTATVQWQAAKVRMPTVPAEGLDRAALFDSLDGFARDWLTVLTGRTSVALNRLAVGEAGSERKGEAGSSPLGSIVLENGPSAMRRRLRPMIEAGRSAGLIAFADADEAFATFFGLVVRDVQIRLLLGEPLAPTEGEIARDAGRATEQFFALYGARPGSG